MGDIIGGVIGGIGSLIGSGEEADAQKKAAKQALTGYNYLTTGAGAPAVTQAENAGVAGSQASQSALASQAGGFNQYNTNATGANNAEAQLLGVGGATPSAQTQQGFNNYLGSTGYQFQLGQGQQAIAGSNAAKGLLDSGATAKALTQYGQNLGSSYFSNYLNQLGGLQTQSANNAQQYIANNQAQAQQGVNAATTVGQIGSGAGAAQGQFTAGAGQSTGTGFAQAANYLGGAVGNALNKKPSGSGS